MKHRGKEMKITVSLLAIALAIAFAPSAARSQAVEVLNADFEKGSQKWERRGNNVSVRTTDKAAATGTKSLHVKDRSEFWQGAQLNLTRVLKKGKAYRFTVSVRLEEGREPALIKLTMQRGDNLWTPIAAATVSDGDWTKLSGVFRPDGGDPYLLIFLESEDARTSFYMDDFKIEAFDADVEQKGTLLKTDFQDGTAQNWLVRGDGVQVFSGQIGDNIVLKVDGRTEDWQGLALDLSTYLFKGRTYRMSISAVLDGNTPSDTVKLRVRRTSSDGKATFEEVASGKVNNAGWTRIEGNYKVEDDGSFLLTVEAKGAKTSFFLDGFELSVP
jgi:endo-1,4-beta-xylanase